MYFRKKIQENSRPATNLLILKNSSTVLAFKPELYWQHTLQIKQGIIRTASSFPSAKLTVQRGKKSFSKLLFLYTCVCISYYYLAEARATLE